MWFDFLLPLPLSLMFDILRVRVGVGVGVRVGGAIKHLPQGSARDYATALFQRYAAFAAMIF